MPELHVNNLLVWEVYRITAALGENMGLDLMGLLDRLGVRQPLIFLRKLGIINRIALKNMEKLRSAQ